jgi:hypothetical protein
VRPPSNRLRRTREASAAVCSAVIGWQNIRAHELALEDAVRVRFARSPEGAGGREPSAVVERVVHAEVEQAIATVAILKAPNRHLGTSREEWHREHHRTCIVANPHHEIRIANECVLQCELSNHVTGISQGRRVVAQFSGALRRPFLPCRNFEKISWHRAFPLNHRPHRACGIQLPAMPVKS